MLEVLIGSCNFKNWDLNEICYANVILLGYNMKNKCYNYKLICILLSIFWIEESFIYKL